MSPHKLGAHERNGSEAKTITGDDLTTKEGRQRLHDAVVQNLCEAVRIPTIVGDQMGHVGTDPAWDIFYEFSAFLKKTFPRIHRTLEHTTINEHGHLFTWKGSDTSLKPVLMMAHSDVVPVTASTTLAWTHDPFSGYCDGEFIWGRGSEDDKSNLMAMMSVVEHLIASSWSPTRTIILSFGFDEEGGSDQSYGAQFLAKHVLELYGKDGIEVIFDESFASVESHHGREVALPAVSEKGYLDVEVQVHCPGGHSSVPPKHTAIGYLAQAVNLLEENQLPALISENHPYFEFLRLTSKFAAAPESLRDAMNSSDPAGATAMYLQEHNEKGLALFRTTTAVDVVSGGDKSNSLPEMARVLVNHRIAFQDSVRTVKDFYLSLLLPWAKEEGLDVVGFGHEPVQTASPPLGIVMLSSEYDLEPSPTTPTNNAQWAQLTNIVREVFGDETIVAPTMLGGNTDTRYYWLLTKNIYRMSPFRASHDPRGSRMHTVDERMPVAGLKEVVDFYLAFMAGFDAFRG